MEHCRSVTPNRTFVKRSQRPFHEQKSSIPRCSRSVLTPRVIQRAMRVPSARAHALSLPLSAGISFLIFIFVVSQKVLSRCSLNTAFMPHRGPLEGFQVTSICTYEHPERVHDIRRQVFTLFSSSSLFFAAASPHLPSISVTDSKIAGLDMSLSTHRRFAQEKESTLTDARHSILRSSGR